MEKDGVQHVEINLRVSLPPEVADTLVREFIKRLEQDAYVRAGIIEVVSAWRVTESNIV